MTRKPLKAQPTGRGPLTGRDIAALDFAYARTIATVLGGYLNGRSTKLDVTPDELMTWAFDMADSFVAHSRGSWAAQEKMAASFGAPSRRNP